MAIRWDSESDWKNSQDSSGTTGRNGELKQGYSRERPDLSTDLIGYWPLHDENATDYSGNNNHGSLNGGITTGVAGKAGLQAMDFNNSDSWIDYGFSNHYSEGSMSFWFKAKSLPSNDGDDHPLMGNGGTGEQCRTSVSTSDTVVFNRQKSGNSKKVESDSISTNEWYHVVSTWNDSENRIRLYIDGEKIGSNDSPGLPGSSDGWRFGRQTRNASGERYHNGPAGQNRLYNRELTESEVKELYEWGSGDYARPPNKYDGGVAYYPLDSSADDAWSENNGSITGASHVDAIRDKGLSFDGSNDSVKITSSELDISQSKSVSAWLKMDGTASSQYQRIFQTGTGSSGRAFEIWVEDENGTLGEIIFRLNYDQSATTKLISYQVPDFDYGQWYNLACVYDYSQSKMQIYLNGVKVAEDSYTEQVGSETEHYIGNWADSGARPWNGVLDDLRIYDKALNPQEIFQLYRYGTRGRDMRKQLVNY